MMDVLIEPVDQSRNAQSPEGLLPLLRPDQVRTSRRRDLAIGRGWRPKLLSSAFISTANPGLSCGCQLGIEIGAVAEHAMHHASQLTR
jgi:hypothetical protein